MFQCYLNAELCLSCVGVIKYFSTYICKKNNRARHHDTYDGIAQFQYARYVPVSEELWRLFEFELIYKNLFTVRLNAHLEKNHTVFFQKRQEGQATQQARPEIKATEWPAANFKWPDTAQTHYAKFLYSFI